MASVISYISLAAVTSGIAFYKFYPTDTPEVSVELYDMPTDGYYKPPVASAAVQDARAKARARVEAEYSIGPNAGARSLVPTGMPDY